MASISIPAPRKGRLNIDRLSAYFLALAAVATALEVAAILIYRSHLPPVVPLFYSLPWGVLRLADPVWLWLLPGISGGTVLVNLVGAHLSSELVLTRILSGTAFMVSLLAMITLFKIIMLGLP